MSRAYTPEECREMFIQQARSIAKYWTDQCENKEYWKDVI